MNADEIGAKPRDGVEGKRPVRSRTFLLVLAAACAIGCAGAPLRAAASGHATDPCLDADHPGVAPSGAPESDVAAEPSLVRVLSDGSAPDFAVKAKIYPEDPGSMFVTTRRGGLSVYDLSDPDQPSLAARWQEVLDVEGQDRLEDLLVVVARTGSLHTFDVSVPGSLRRLASLDLAPDPGLGEAIAGAILRAIGNPFDSLHTTLYRAEDGRLYALVTAPTTKELIAVDVEDPERPEQVGILDTGIQFIEGISVHRGHAFVGGFGWSGVFSAVDVRDPRSMRVVASVEGTQYRQMVSEMSSRDPDLLYAALWGDPGGLAIFDVADPPNFHEVGSILSGDLAHANRVKVRGDLAFLPLEQEPGGFAIVDVSRADAPRRVSIVRGIPDLSVPYTLALSGDHLYVFGTKEATMAVFRIACARVAR